MSFPVEPNGAKNFPRELPKETLPTAQKLACRLIEVDGNKEKIMNLFSKHATFIFDHPKKEMNREDFEKALVKGNLRNIDAIGPYSCSFSAVSKETSDIEWIVEGFQFRLGLVTNRVSFLVSAASKPWG